MNVIKRQAQGGPPRRWGRQPGLESHCGAPLAAWRHSQTLYGVREGLRKKMMKKM